MSNVLGDFVEIMVSAIVDLAQGIASGVVAMAKALFLEVSVSEGVETVTGLSVFGGIIAIFAGLGLATAITTRVYTWITTLGH